MKCFFAPIAPKNMLYRIRVFVLCVLCGVWRALCGRSKGRLLGHLLPPKGQQGKLKNTSGGPKGSKSAPRGLRPRIASPLLMVKPTRGRDFHKSQNQVLNGPKRSQGCPSASQCDVKGRQRATKGRNHFLKAPKKKQKNLIFWPKGF